MRFLDHFKVLKTFQNKKHVFKDKKCFFEYSLTEKLLHLWCINILNKY